MKPETVDALRRLSARGYLFTRHHSRPQHVAAQTNTAMALVNRGYAIHRPAKGGQRGMVTITSAGDNALELLDLPNRHRGRYDD